MVSGSSEYSTHHDQHSQKHEFTIGQNIWVKNVHRRPHWISGVITEMHDPVSYVVRLCNGDKWHQHINQLRCNDSSTDVSANPSLGDDFILPNTSAIPDTPNSPPQPQAPVPPYPTKIRRPCTCPVWTVKVTREMYCIDF